MNTDIWMKKLLAILGAALMGTMLATAAYATVEQVPVEVTFVAAIAISETGTLQVGLLDVGMLVNDTVTINTNDTFSESASNVVGGNQRAALLTITAEGLVGITITAGNVLGATHYTLDTWLCSYASGADTACTTGTPYNLTSDPSGSATLEIGVTLTGLGGASAGNDDSTFDVTVTYQ